jgi:hypothetical protein
MESEGLARLLDAAANFLNGRSAYSAAEPLFCEALALGEKLLGPDHPDVGQWLNNSANLFLNTGRYSEAERSIDARSRSERNLWDAITCVWPRGSTILPWC